MNLGQGCLRSLRFDTVFILGCAMLALGSGLGQPIPSGSRINVWHNAQYLLLVWFYNNNRFHGRTDPQARVLSYLSQTKSMLLYFVVCLILAGLFYEVVAIIDGWLLHSLTAHQGKFLTMSPEFFRSSGLVDLNLVPNSSAMAAAIAMLSYQVIDQHHYVVDAFLCRVDNREHHRGLGLGP